MEQHLSLAQRLVPKAKIFIRQPQGSGEIDLQAIGEREPLFLRFCHWVANEDEMLRS